MRKREKDKRIKRSIFSAKNFLIFFFFNAFIVTCNLIMFLNLNRIDINILSARWGAITTAGNVVFFGLIFSIFDNIRQKITIEKPVMRLIDATSKIRNGDYSARIKPIHKKRKKNEMDVLIDDFNQMAEELSGVETLKTDFISNVSHELKTPLAVILNYTTMLQDDNIDEETRLDYTKSIASAAKNLSGLITNILKLNKLENQQIFPERKRYDIGEQICQCLLSFEYVWDKKNIEIECSIEEKVLINADEELISIIWNNLLSNAFKFTPEYGKVFVSMKSIDNKIVAEITDTGCGMTQNEIERIFDKFYQADVSHAAKGNGLGLALVKRVLDISNGEITVASTPGEGSTFTVTLNAE